MDVFVQVKSLGKRRNSIEKRPLTLPDSVASVRDLLVAIVTQEVLAYNERLETQAITPYLTSDALEDAAAAGAVRFAPNAEAAKAKLPQAIENALQSFEDGLYRVFLNEVGLESLDEALSLKEGDTFTFIRLTMLTGRLW